MGSHPPCQVCSDYGVRQGGVLSPLLFYIYIDELLSQINSCGYGCKMGNANLGAVAYADYVRLGFWITTFTGHLF